MKIEVKLPTDMEVQSVAYDAKTRVLTVTPRFIKGAAAAPVAYVDVTGDSGNKREFLLSVSGTTGTLDTQLAKASRKPVFDTMPPTEFQQKMAKARSNRPLMKKAAPTSQEAKPDAPVPPAPPAPSN